MNNTTKYLLEAPASQKAVHAAIAPIFTLLGLVGNSLLISAFFVTKKLRTSTNTFILMVSVSDLVLILLMLSSKISITVLQKRNTVVLERDTLCFSLTMVAYISYGVSVYGQGAIAINRYFKICHHNRYPKIYTKRNVLLICVGIWIYSICLIFGIAFGGRCFFTFDGLICRIDPTQKTPCVYLVIAFGILIPTFTIFGFYFKIFITIRATSLKVNRGEKIDAKTKKAIISLFTAFVLMVILFWPYAIVAAIDSNIHTRGVGIAMRYAVIWTYLSTGTNPIVYGIMNTTFREGYKNVLCCCCRKIRKSKISLPLADANSSTSGATRSSGKSSDSNATTKTSI
ncbi:melatonin receptor type 1A-like [Tubulanus polymorphus]|uniref:melatonin receptor type 1A-like n=1 Tax=Tubulanus polymorphus TaxID=672921 RepID=UPI003DA2CED8